MAKLKLYSKRGNLSREEKKHLKALEKFFKENPDKAENIIPAKNSSGLQKMYNEHIVTDVEFEETAPDIHNEAELDKILEEQEKADGSGTSGVSEVEEEETHETFKNKMREDFELEGQSVADPFNRDNPVLRDYVPGSSPDLRQGAQPGAGSIFNEPQNFKDSFEIPDQLNQEKLSDTGKVEQNKPPVEQREKYVQPQPINPAYDDMANAKKRSSTKRFAKYIVEATCMLSEKGFVWFATKDITEAKIAEYELKEEFDLGLMLTVLDEQNREQQVTIKHFFKIQCSKADFLAKIDPDEKQDLVNALTEVLLEKGVGPTPTQELLLIALKIFGGQAMTLFALTAQTNSVLNQLRAMSDGTSERSNVEQAANSDVIKDQIEKKMDFQETTEAIKEQTSKNRNRSRGNGKGTKKEGDFKGLSPDQDSKNTKE